MSESDITIFFRVRILKPSPETGGNFRGLCERAAALAALAFGLLSAASPPPDAPIARRLSNLLSLIASEYNLGVRDGRIIDPGEYAEARLFVDQATDVAQGLTFHSQVEPAMNALKTVIVQRRPAVEVQSALDRVLVAIEKRVPLPDPALPVGVSVEDGRRIFEANCSKCHGPPPHAINHVIPPDFSDADFVRARNPLQFYTAVTEGVKGTPMPAWLDTLDERQRWSVVYYLYSLAFPDPRADDGHRRFLALSSDTRNRLTGGGIGLRRSMNDLGDELSGLPPLAPRNRDDIEFYVLNLPRLESEQTAGSATLGRTLEQVVSGLSSVKSLVEAGHTEDARRKLADTYSLFERIEPVLAATPDGRRLVKVTEAVFLRLQGDVGNPPRFADDLQSLQAQLGSHRPSSAESLDAPAVFTQSFLILLREGFEAFLILTAVIGLLVKIGRPDQVRFATAGAGAGVLATALTALVVQTLLSAYMAAHPASSHYVEAGAMIVASVVLFLVSYWLVTKSTVQRWTEYIRGRIGVTLGRGSAWTLAVTGFLAVYREGFETVIFYQALLLQTKDAHAVWLGAAAGAVALLLVSLAFYGFTLKLPIRPFFMVTSLLLYAMSVAFIGNGLHELQEAGSLPVTIVARAPAVEWLGLFPTAQTLIAQAVLGLAAIYALALFLRNSSKLLPAPAAAPDRATK